MLHMKQIQCKFVSRVVVPANALKPEEYEYQTSDGIICRISYEIGWKIEDEWFLEELEDICQKIHGCSFETIKSLWFSRLGRLSDWWYVIKLTKK